MNKLLVLAALLAVFAGTFAFSGGVAQAATCAVPSGPYPTIQSAANDVTCTVINVAAGVYAENVTINFPTALNGAQANVAVAGRTSASPAESKITSVVATPVITINVAGVTVNGFSISESVPTFAAFGITVNAGGNGAVIQHNIIDGISSADGGGNGTAQGVFLRSGPDGVQILNNRIENITSVRSAKGVLLGENGAANAPDGTTVQGNVIRNVTSLSRGSYGVSVANATAPVMGLNVQGNTISNLSSGTGCGSSVPPVASPCGWLHAVGLEGNTPNANILGNTFSGFTAASIDQTAVFFEANPSYSTVQVHNNNFNLTSASFGVALHPSQVVSGSANATCNWWNAANGPSGAGTGTGTKVGPNVTFSPWLAAAAPSACAGAVVTDKDQCKNDGWKTLFRADGTSFKNQGDCVSYTNNGR